MVDIKFHYIIYNLLEKCSKSMGRETILKSMKIEKVSDELICNRINFYKDFKILSAIIYIIKITQKVMSSVSLMLIPIIDDYSKKDHSKNMIIGIGGPYMSRCGIHG